MAWKNDNKWGKLLCNVCIVHLEALNEALNHGLIVKNVHRVIQFNQTALLEPYIDMNTKLRTEAKNDFERDLFQQINNSFAGTTMERVRKHRDIKLDTTYKKRNYFVSEPNYHTTKWISECFLSIEKKEIKVKINNPVYLGLPILEISKKLIYDFCYDHIKPKYQSDDTKLCYKDTVTLLFVLKPKIFMKILQILLKKNLIH